MSEDQADEEARREERAHRRARSTGVPKPRAPVLELRPQGSRRRREPFRRADLLRYARRCEALQAGGLLPESEADYRELQALQALLALAAVRALLHDHPLGIDDDPPAAS